MSAIAIYLRSDLLGQRNLEHAIETGIWGFTHDRPHYARIMRGTPVLIASGFSHPTLGGSPRRKSAPWSEGILRRIAVFRAESGVRQEGTLLRPDEVEERELRYPFRVSIKHLRDVRNVEIAQLPFDLAEGFRVSAMTGGTGNEADAATLPALLRAI